MHDLLEYAIQYAEAGLKVFPCKPDEKVPMIKRGVKDASNDVRVVEKWWTDSPRANIGLSCEGLFVIDVDGRDNTWPDDHERAEELAAYPQSITPRGKHIFFRLPEGKLWRNWVSKLAPRVDTRTTGGYVIVPPSVVAGKLYRWVEGNELI